MLDTIQKNFFFFFEKEIKLMEQVEELLKLDDLTPGSFGSIEKGISYAIILCMTIPILLIPALYVTVRQSIFKLTFLLLTILSFFLLIVRFKFSWFVWTSSQLQEIYNRYNARIRI